MEKVTITSDEFIEKTGNVLIELFDKGCPAEFMPAGLLLLAAAADKIFGNIPKQEYEAIYHTDIGMYTYIVGKGGTIEPGLYALDIYLNGIKRRQVFATEKECYISLLDHIERHNKKK